jgi:hypothetical protein
MSEVYSDVGAWEAPEGEEGRKRKRPTKKDLVRRTRTVCSLTYSYGILSGTVQTAQEAEKDCTARLPRAPPTDTQPLSPKVEFCR